MRDVLVIHPHALVHGVDAADIQAVFADGLEGALAEDEDPPRWLLVGFDTKARLLELVVIELPGGDWLAIHAMAARKGTLQQLRRARSRG